LIPKNPLTGANYINNNKINNKILNEFLQGKIMQTCNPPAKFKQQKILRTLWTNIGKQQFHQDYTFNVLG